MTLTHPKEPDTMSNEKVTHLAGPVTALHFKKDQEDTRAIQRCLVCGELLVDKRVIIKKKRVKASFWSPGDWVIKSEDGSTMSVLGPDNFRLPKNSCAHGVEPPKFPDLSEEELKEISVESGDEDGEDDEED